MSELMRFLAENSSRSTARFNPFSAARKTQFNTGGGGLSDPFIRPSGTFADPRLPGGGGVRFNPFRPGGRFGSDPTFGRSGGPFDGGGGEGFGHGPQPDPGPPPIPAPPGGGGGGDIGGRVGQHPIGGFILPSGEHIPRENILVYDDGSRDWWDTLGNFHHDTPEMNQPIPLGGGSSNEGSTGAGGRRGEGFFGRGGTAVDPRLSEGFGHGPQPDPGPPILPTPQSSGGGAPINPFDPNGYPFGPDYQAAYGEGYTPWSANLDPTAAAPGLNMLGLNSSGQLIRFTDPTQRSQWDEFARQTGVLRSTVPGMSPGEWLANTFRQQGFGGGSIQDALDWYTQISGRGQPFKPDVNRILNATPQSVFNAPQFRGSYTGSVGATAPENTGTAVNSRNPFDIARSRFSSFAGNNNIPFNPFDIKSDQFLSQFNR